MDPTSWELGQAIGELRSKQHTMHFRMDAAHAKIAKTNARIDTWEKRARVAFLSLLAFLATILNLLPKEIAEKILSLLVKIV